MQNWQNTIADQKFSGTLIFEFFIHERRRRWYYNRIYIWKIRIKQDQFYIFGVLRSKTLPDFSDVIWKADEGDELHTGNCFTMSQVKQINEWIYLTISNFMSFSSIERIMARVRVKHELSLLNTLMKCLSWLAELFERIIAKIRPQNMFLAFDSQSKWETIT